MESNSNAESTKALVQLWIDIHLALALAKAESVIRDRRVNYKKANKSANAPPPCNQTRSRVQCGSRVNVLLGRAPAKV